MKYQNKKNKIAEVTFREKLAKQQLNKSTFFDNERTFIDMHEELKRRIKKTTSDFRKLKKIGVDFSTYLEIGAENCERAMVLDSIFKAKGLACDISLYSLKAGAEFTKKLGFKKIPKRLVCDAYRLPYQDNSLPFVFCYQTLHHFPDPKPVIDEVYRVLKPGGYFFFDEEPVKQIINLNLWRRPTCLRPWEKFLKYTGILPFISRIGKTEVDYGILEEVFSLKTWENALSAFDKVEATIKPFPKGPTSTIKKTTKKWLNPAIPTFLLVAWWGGGISALCQKKGHRMKSNFQTSSKIFTCPNCQIDKKNKKVPFLKKSTDKKNYSCALCKTKYPIRSAIPIILPTNEMSILYGKN